MFNNWMKDFDPFNYNNLKKSIQDTNNKVIKFWRDFYNDICNHVKKEED